MTVSARSQQNTNFESEFIQLSEKFCAYLAKYNISLKPYSDPGLANFSRLSVDEKIKTLRQINDTLEIYSEAESSGEKLRDSSKLLWRALSKMKLSPCSDIFSKITDEDAIVIYSLDHTQIFRNLVYFDSISATFEEISTLPWWELHVYPEEMIAGFQQIPQQLEAGLIQETIPAGVPETELIEALGADKIRTSVHIKWFSPLRSENKIVGLISVATTKILN